MNEPRERREDTNQASVCMKIGCMNVRGWGVGKCEDVCKEVNEWNFDVIGLTETHLRNDVRMEGCDYVMMGKGRKTQETLGGGVAFLLRKERNFKVEEIDVGSCANSEDVLAVRLECMNNHGRPESMVMIVVYMTVEGERAVRENSEKYAILKNGCDRLPRGKNDCHG